MVRKKGVRSRKLVSKQDSHRKILLLSLLIILLFILSLASFFLLKILTPFNHYTFQSHVKVADYVGINLDNDKLYFGSVFPGGHARRSIVVSSPVNAFVTVSKAGDSAGWIISKPYFFINASDNVTIDFVVFVPSNASFGNYTSNITLKFYTPIAEYFLT